MLTQEQKDEILNSKEFAKLLAKPKVKPYAGLTMRERIAQRNAREAEIPTGEETGQEDTGIFGRIKETGGDIFETIQGAGEAVGERARNIGETFKKTASGEYNPLTAGVKTVGEVGGLFNDIAGGVYSGVAKVLVSQDTEDSVKEKVAKFAEDSGALDALRAGSDVWQQFEQQNPQTAEVLKGIGNIGLAGIDVFSFGGAGKATKAGKEILEETAKRTAKEISEQATKIKEPLQTGFKSVTNKIEKIKEKNPIDVIKQKQQAKKETLEDIVSPKFNISEKIKAIRENRIKTGEDFPTLGKAPDVVEPSKKANEIADTLRKYVDDVEDLDQFEIVKASQDITNEIAKEIRPKLKELQFRPNQKKELFEEWEFIKKNQSDSAFFENRAVQKFQENTERFLRQINKKVRGEDGKFREWTMDDLWDFRIAYDNTADAKKIKKLLSKSEKTGEEELLVEMWLENREMLNQFIKDEAMNLGEDIGKKWNDMSDLYQAIDNIASKADIDLVGEQDIIRKFITIPTKIKR